MEKVGEKGRKTKFLIIYIFIIVILFLIGFYGFYSLLNKDTMYEGIKIEKFDVSNMNKKEALNLIKKEMDKDIDGRKMILKYKDKNYTIGVKELGFYYDYKKAIDESYSIGRDDSIFSRLKTIYNTKKYGKKIKIKSGYDVKSIDKLADKISKDIDLESKNAIFHFNKGNMSVTEEQIGKKVNKKLLKKKVKENIYKLEDIEIPVEKINPKVTKAQLSRINGVIGEFSTSFKTSSSDRKENIRISTKALNGRLVMPGETFSFNESTGPRNEQNGYKKANIIVQGEFVPGFGGGLCQVSTTLYNALLSSKLNVVERHPHSMPVKYVPPDKDAAVSYGALDLKFRNDFDFPVYIDTQATKDSVKIYVYGDKKS